MKFLLSFSFVIGFLYACVFETPAVFFLISLVFLIIDYTNQRDEYFEGKKLDEKINSFNDLDERIKYMSSFSEEWLALYFAQQKLKDEFLLNIEETLLERLMCEADASEEQQKAAAYVYKALLKFQGKKSRCLE